MNTEKEIIKSLNLILDTLNENQDLNMPMLKSFIEDYLSDYYEIK